MTLNDLYRMTEFHSFGVSYVNVVKERLILSATKLYSNESGI